ncbi:MAG: 16S rRNA (uracil(1498)-N(3))-methyltransferase [Dysgonamonadaceae bacterium]|jgi:16S rRNA (uracil1498-N3)-methyltransferase|nr:16S rRNA (uracil(1498)-N(3))-methyltransferase [Dysgonamonadaceae bacterium]
MHFFYTPDIMLANELPEQEARHCIRVLRLKEGDAIRLTDGKGYFYDAVITLADPKHCKVGIAEIVRETPSWNCNIEIALAPTKNIDRTEWFAEKATEIGINKISFLKCRYSERKDINLPRIEKITVSAMKQSMKATLPELQDMIDFKKVISGDFPGQKFIAHCYPGEKRPLCEAYKPGGDSLILIGPEGDFSEEELSMAMENGFKAISLGESRLRTETAALAACQTIHIVNQLNKR